MRKIFKRVYITILIISIILVSAYYILQKREVVKEIQYGVSFNTLYARELGLDYKEVYIKILEELGVKRLRLAAHWNMVEPQKDQYNFEEIDFQLDKAEENNAKVILAVGRRLPRWPECHVPDWAKEREWREQKEEIKEYIEIVVSRYKDRDVIEYWQVENEPYLSVFAKEHCGELDEEFLKEEIALVKKLDPTRSVILTDSGNLGLWAKAYREGDVFGTSVYVYLWNDDIGPFKSFLPPSFYRAKTSLMEILFGKQESFLSELSLEPWLLKPVTETSIEVQLSRMNIQKFDEIVNFAKETSFEKQYLWGAEWWYYMKEKGHPEFWDKAKEIF